MNGARQTFGNIPPVWQGVFYLVAALACAIFAYGVWRRFCLWRQGSPIDVRGLWTRGGREMLAKLRPGLGRVLVDGLGQKRVRGHGLPSVAHGLMFAGFMILLLGTTLLEINHLAGMVSRSWEFHRGSYYLVYEATLDFFGLLFLAGTILFFARRLTRSRTTGHRATDWFVLIGFLAIGLTGYLVEGLRLCWDQPTGVWAQCSLVGLWVASGFSALNEVQARSAHFAAWWLHALLVFGFIAAIPYTRLLHMIAGPLNLFFAQPVLGLIRPVTLEEVEATGRVGVSDLRQFTQQQLLSLDACMECGRCEAACPAFGTDKPLSPRRVVQDLKGLMTVTLGPRRGDHPVPTLHGETISAATLWACTACSACVEVCPVRIDPLTLIIDMRRHLVSEGGLGGTAATALRGLQANANPWGLPPGERFAWAESLSARPAKPIAP